LTSGTGHLVYNDVNALAIDEVLSAGTLGLTLPIGTVTLGTIDDVTTVGGSIAIQSGGALTSTATNGDVVSTGSNSATAPTVGGEVLLVGASINLSGDVTANGGNHTGGGTGAAAGVITLKSTTSTINVSNVSSNGGTGTPNGASNTVQMSAVTNITQNAAPTKITGLNLKLIAGGNVDLPNLSNDVTTMAAD